VTQIEGVQQLQMFQVFNFLYQIVLQIQVAQLCLVVQVFNALNAIVLKPQALESCVFLQVLNLPVTCSTNKFIILIYD
jgi:hypothetical protein